MSLTTHSAFYFGHRIDETNFALDFREIGGELLASLDVGEYTLEEFVTECARAMTAVGGRTYSVTVNRATRKVTVSSPFNFSLLINSGSRKGSGVWSLLGFTGADRTGTNTYTANLPSGLAYSTQFILQSYIPSAHFVKAADATVNKAASGRVEVFRFGEERFTEMNFKFITDRQSASQDIIRNRTTGVQDFLNFMNYAITKAPIEFMPDENTPGTFEKVILESTPDDSKGTGFKLRELYDQGLPGFYESGVIRMRVIE